MISPLVGPQKTGDLLAEPLLEAHTALLNAPHFPGAKALLNPFPNYSRYAGPREAVFTALCQKNMGCSHFIVCRDHTGVSDFDSYNASQRIFDHLGEIGITPLTFDPIAFDASEQVYRPEADCHEPKFISEIDGMSQLLDGRSLPDWYMSQDVQAVLLRRVHSGQQLLHERG